MWHFVVNINQGICMLAYMEEKCFFFLDRSKETERDGMGFGTQNCLEQTRQDPRWAVREDLIPCTFVV